MVVAGTLAFEDITITGLVGINFSPLFGLFFYLINTCFQVPNKLACVDCEDNSGHSIIGFSILTQNVVTFKSILHLFFCVIFFIFFLIYENMCEWQMQQLEMVEI